MDRIAIPVAFMVALGLVVILVGGPLVPHFAIPGAPSLAAALGTAGDVVRSLGTPAQPQVMSPEEVPATYKGSRRASVLGLAARWAGAVEVYAPAASYPAAYPDLPGVDKAPVAVETEQPAMVTKPNGGDGGRSSEGSVGYEKD